MSGAGVEDLGVGPTRPVFLHVGLQKTGTSYLQSIFWANQDVLAGAGLDLVPGSKRETFVLRLAVREQKDARFEAARVARALPDLTAALAAAPGARALVSEETLAAAPPAQIQRLVSACGDREVHVIVTARDVARQIPSAWVQRLRRGGEESLEEYAAAVTGGDEATVPFRATHDLVDVLDRWGRVVPAARIHVVTVPPAGADRSLLLTRFCSVVGIDPALLETGSPTRNESLGRADAEVLRRVNGRLTKEDRWRFVYGSVGKRWFAARMLGRQRGDHALAPESARGWCEEHARSVVARLGRGDVDVVGDAADLVPSAAAFETSDQAPDEHAVADAALDALAAILADRIDALRTRQAAKTAGAPAPPVDGPDPTAAPDATSDDPGLRGRLGRFLGR